MGLSIGLDTAVTALRASQLAIDVASHNVANADTEGYSRQVVDFRAIPPARDKWNTSGVPRSQLGLGVDSSRIRRMRDGLLDVQYRDVRRMRDQYHAEASALGQAEVTLNEPSDVGLQELTTRFFNGFRDLASQPESVAARAAAIEQGSTLASAFNRAAKMLTAQRDDLDGSVGVKVQDINSKAKEIADLNAQIRLAKVSGNSANDLEDHRDLLLDQLSGLAGVTVENGDDGIVNVSIGGRSLVDNVSVNELAAVADPSNNGLKKVVWASDSADAGLTSGEVVGILKSRDQHVSGLMTSLDEMAGAMITAVNTAHSAGYGLNNATGLDFFTGTTAADMAVNQTLRDSPESLATSSAANEPGNTDATRAIAGVQDQKLLSGSTATIDDFYRSIVSRLGVASQQAQLQSDNQDVLTQHIETARQSVSGVSLDEEMTNILKSQHAYQAAAKVINVIDSLLDTLVNRTIG